MGSYIGEIPAGTVVGDMTVVGLAGYTDYGSRLYLLCCNKCGRELVKTSGDIGGKRGIWHKSCGWGLRESTGRFYNIWHNMRERTKPTSKVAHDRKYYVDRGIKSDAFELFVDFYDTMYTSYLEHVKKYGEENTTIDRVDGKGDYTPENCRWATYEEQNNNLATNLKFSAISPTGKKFITQGFVRFAKEYNLPSRMLYLRLHRHGETTFNGWIFRVLDDIECND